MKAHFPKRYNGAIYLFANILVAAVPFLLMPIMTRYLGPKGYGEVAMFMALLSILGAFVGLSVHGAISARWFNQADMVIDIKEYVANCIYIVLVTFVIVFLLVYIFRETIAVKLSLPHFWVSAAVVVTVCNSIILIRLCIWQVEGGAINYGITQTLIAIGVGGVSYAFVVEALLGVEGRLWAQSTVYMAAALFSFISLANKGYIKFKVNVAYIKDALKFGVPLIPHVVGGFMLATIDRVIVSDSLGVDRVGVYMVAVQLSLGLYILADAFNKAFMPWLFSQLEKNNNLNDVQVVKVSYLFAVFLLIVVILSFFLSSWVVGLVAGDDFLDAASVLPLLVLAQAFHGMYYLVTNYLFYQRKTHLTAMITIASGSLGVFVVLVLIDSQGLFAAAIGQVVAMFTLWLATWFFANRIHPMPWFSRMLLVKN